MKANAPEKIYVDSKAIGDDISTTVHTKRQDYPTCIEYTRTDAFIEKVINFLNYKLDDVVAIRVPGTLIPHHVVKKDFIEDLKKDIKG